METIKIIVQKADEPTLIAEKLIDSEADVIIFSVPKFSRFGESINNFNLIRREAEILEKEVIIESVDDDVLNLARESGLEARHSFLEERKRRFSDIVVNNKKRAVSKQKYIEEEDDDFEEEIVIKPKKSERFHSSGEPTRPRPPKPKRRRARSGSTKGKLLFGVVILVVIFFGYLAVAILPRAEVSIIREKQQWNFTGPINIDTDVVVASVDGPTIPGQLFTRQETFSSKFKANGKKFIEKRSTGQLTIYNEFSSKSQQLVVNTRFLTPDNILFRLTKGVTVPGAKVEGGKITRSSITVPVIADKAGPEFNVDKVARLSIPGFSGSERYTGFYGELKQGTSGGFTGEALVPTEEDINLAKKESLATIEKSLTEETLNQIPTDFVRLDGATRFTLLRQTIDIDTDSQGNFTVINEAEFSTLVFKEADIALLSAAQLEADQEEEGFEVVNQTITYEPFTLNNPKLGAMKLPVSYEASLAKEIDVDNLKNRIEGQSEEGLKQIIFSLPGIENAQINLWPFWVRSVPSDVDRIEILVQ